MRLKVSHAASDLRRYCRVLTVPVGIMKGRLSIRPRSIHQRQDVRIKTKCPNGGKKITQTTAVNGI